MSRLVCATCRHLTAGAAEFERLFPGILILSSGGGDSRGDQGVCRLHNRMVLPNMSCTRYEARSPADAKTGPVRP